MAAHEMVLMNERLLAAEKRLGVEARERAALREQLLVQEALGREMAASNERQLAQEDRLTKEKEREVQSLKDELAFSERLIVALRQQGAAAERGRDAMEQLLAVKMPAPSGGEHNNGRGVMGFFLPPNQETRDADMIALLRERCAAEAESRQAADAEARALRLSLEKAREDLSELRKEGPQQQIRVDAENRMGALQAQLDGVRSQMLERTVEREAALESAEQARAQLLRQHEWLERREAQRDQARRDAASLRAELGAARALCGNLAAQLREAREAGAATSAETILRDSHAAVAQAEGRAEALQEKLAEVAEARAAETSAAAERLAEEAEAARIAAGKTQGLQQELEDFRNAQEKLRADLREVATGRERLEFVTRDQAKQMQLLEGEATSSASRLQATLQEKSASDALAATLRQQLSRDEAEKATLREEAESAARKAAALMEALATESSRLAKAWEQREAVRSSLAKKEGQISEMQAALFSVREQLSQREGEVELMREQARLSESVIRASDERAELKQHALDAARRESAEGAVAVAAARGELHGLQKDQLPGKDVALQRASDEILQMRAALSARDERLAHLHAELERTSDSLLASRHELRAAEEARRALEEGDLSFAREEIETLRSQLKLAALDREALEHVLEGSRRRQGRAEKEAAVRLQQLGISHEARKLLELEATLLSERLRTVDSAAELAESRHMRERDMMRLHEANVRESEENFQRNMHELATTRDRCVLLESKIASRDEQLALLEQQLLASDERGETRELARQRLVAAVRAARDQIAERDGVLSDVNNQFERLTAELAQRREEALGLTRRAETAEQEVETARRDTAALRVKMEVSEAAVTSRDVRLKSLHEIVQATKEELQAQLAMLREEADMSRTSLDARDLEIEQALESGATREQQARLFVSNMQSRLERAIRLMASKDESLAVATERLAKTLEALRLAEMDRDKMAEESNAARAAQAAERTRADALQQEHILLEDDLVTASAALDGYRQAVIAAEARTGEDEVRIAQLQATIKELQVLMPNEGVDAYKSSGGGSFTTQGPGSRVHFLYFLSSFLLLKTALAAQGTMANVPAQDVFDEIVQNQVPLEEWPTYIFTRIFEPRGERSEIAALKAAAKAAGARRATATLSAC